jgi:hypothetical protein
MTIPAEVQDFRTEVWTVARDRYQDEYKELTDLWSKLDGKAQGAVTIAGIFLAALFAATRGEAIPASSTDRYLLAVAIVLLVGSVVAAGFSLHVRRTGAGPSGLDLERAAGDLVDHGTSAASVAELRIRFLRTQVNAWSRCIGDFREENRRKARSLRWSQGLVIAGAAVAVLVTLHLLIARPSS